ncbi:MAG: TonB-dependent receptor [Myxococcota bacterium]
MVCGRPATSALLGGWLALSAPLSAHAAAPEIGPPGPEPEPSAEEEDAGDEPDEDRASAPRSPYGEDADVGAADGDTRLVRVGSRRPERTQPDRAGSVVTREELEQRLPRSAPDALQGEPGVYIQQTAHGQGSPYLRGLTGQQTVMFFDDVRINNATFRQGPNQYFFTIDASSIQQLEVVRGSASTRYGSDALGGALLAEPQEPTMRIVPGRRWMVHPRVTAKMTTADAEKNGRARVDLSYRGKLGILVGVGYRDVGQLRSGGRVIAPATGLTQKVPPLFEADDKTQRGTGFRELTPHARVVWQPRTKTRFTLGYYDYRQFDVPRTDKCPPPTAPENECLLYLQQFRTLAYGAFDGIDLHPAADRVRLTLSYQNQHERRRLNRGASATEVHGDDDVHSLGTNLKIATDEFDLAPWVSLQGRYGTDAYLDLIDSQGWIYFDDVQIRADLTRGQYLDAGRYLSSGVWGEAMATFFDVLRLRGGGRGALVYAQAEGDPDTQSAPVDRTWATVVGNAGLSVQAVPWLSFHANLDQGFRAPNMDDLTSRQQTGPGFQFENSNLDPERSLSTEAGMKIDHPFIELAGWVYQNRIRDLIGRAPRTVEQCPMGEVGCGSSQTRFQLVNLDGFAYVRGAEADLRVYLPLDFRLRGTVSYAWGEGPNPVAAQSPDQPPRLPLSRIPPLNGLAEIGWRGGQTGLYVFGVLRWARAQTRLALADRSDARIPEGGTPGYVVVDVRAGYRLAPYMLAALVFENVGDAAYRNHGSSVNGPGRGLSLLLEFGF